MLTADVPTPYHYLQDTVSVEGTAVSEAKELLRQCLVNTTLDLVCEDLSERTHSGALIF